jgi:hypothetical protein
METDELKWKQNTIIPHFSLFCTSRSRKFRGVARKNKNIARTPHLIRASELFDNLTGFWFLDRALSNMYRMTNKIH